ncbi:MAG: HNH endonuclease [Chloroflexota bacterium]
MSRHYLLYWKLETVEYHYFGEGLDHIASNQLKKVEPGDVVWVCTVRGGDLLLAGRMVAGTVIDESDADEEFDEFDLFDARWHVSAANGTTEPMQLINLTELAVTLSLRFESPSDRLRLNRQGRLNAMSLYHIRTLTDESAALLNFVWYDGRESVDAVEQVDTGEDTFIYAEGKPIVKTRTLRQRSSRLTNEAKSRYLEEHGELRCQICGLNFEELYGEIGAGYIETHHEEPISQMDGEQFVDVDGVVLLCANCHRMVHRKTPPYSVEDLKRIVTEQREK